MVSRPRASTVRPVAVYLCTAAPELPDRDDGLAAAGSRSRCAAHTTGRLLPGRVTQTTAARRCSVAGVLVTLASTRNVRVPPAGSPADQDTCPPRATPWSLAEMNSSPVDSVWVIVRREAATVPVSRTVTV